MIYKKLAALAAATVIGVALIAAPAQARMGGFGGGGFGGGFHGGGFHGGGFGGGGFAGARVGSLGGFRGGFAGARVASLGGFRGAGFARPAFVGRSAFIGRSAFVGRHAFFPGRRFAFFPHRRFIAPFFGFGALYAAAGYSSCWTWVPTPYGWQRAWVCDSNYGYY
jgi:hypothetical protein